MNIAQLISGVCNLGATSYDRAYFDPCFRDSAQILPRKASDTLGMLCKIDEKDGMSKKEDNVIPIVGDIYGHH